MAKTGAEARALREGAHREDRGRLRAGARRAPRLSSRARGPSAPALEPWDVAYYSEKLKKARYDFDDEELRPYFPADRVLNGAFALAERLYGVKIVPVEGVSVWDSSVKAFKMLDEAGVELGAFYVDPYPRENKRGGAWMHGLHAAVPPDRHLAVFAANVNPPAGGKPSLLTHRDVETIFHEFGHLLHHCLSKVTVRSLAGTRVVQDFVELPSQIMENWCWEREGLNLFARHYQTGAPIPDALARALEGRAHLPRRDVPDAPARLRGRRSRPAPNLRSSEGRARPRVRERASSLATRRLPCPPTTACSPGFFTSSLTLSGTRPATTPTSGPRCSTPTPSGASRRRSAEP